MEANHCTPPPRAQTEPRRPVWHTAVTDVALPVVKLVARQVCGPTFALIPLSPHAIVTRSSHEQAVDIRAQAPQRQGTWRIDGSTLNLFCRTVTAETSLEGPAEYIREGNDVV